MRIFLCISLSISVSWRFDVDGSADAVEGCASVGDGARGGGEDGSSAGNVEATTVGMVASVVILIKFSRGLVAPLLRAPRAFCELCMHDI